jgi:hypothetical protein
LVCHTESKRGIRFPSSFPDPRLSAFIRGKVLPDLGDN